MEEESENAAKLNQWATTETEVDERLRKFQQRCEVDKEFEKWTTETEVGDDGNRSLRET